MKLVKKVKFPILVTEPGGAELIPVYRQSATTFCQACSYLCSFHQMAPPVHYSTYPIPAY